MPPAVQKLPENQQRQFLAAFNSALKQYGSEERAFAVAWSAVNKQRQEAIHPDFVRILSLFTKRFGAESGTAKFEEFLAQNNISPFLPYRPEYQFKESFDWVEPLIVPYKQDHEAKYYLVRALTANISMNNKDYGPPERLEKAANTLSWRPINLNHNHQEWLPYPRNRVDYATSSDLSVEATMRIDNKEAHIQKMLDEKKIVHPSIEGRPDPEGGYHFTGMALLTVGEQIPGDPLTEILPLAFNESVGRQFCELKDGKLECGCQPQNEVNVKMSKEESETNLKFATLELENVQQKQTITELTEKVEAQKVQLEKQAEANKTLTEKINAEWSLKFQEALNVKYSQEGTIKTLKENVEKAETQKKLAEAEQKEAENRATSWQRKFDEMVLNREEVKKLNEALAQSNDKLFKENTETHNKVLSLTTELTEARKSHADTLREKERIENENVSLNEGIEKAKKFQTWAFKELKSLGKEVVMPTPKPSP